jgi:hypothetical protein
MLQDPAARQYPKINGFIRTEFDADTVTIDEEEREPLLEVDKKEPVKLGDLPDFLIYVFKTKQYDPL